MRSSTSKTAVFLVPSESYRIDDFVDAASRLGVEMVIATDAHHTLAEDMGATLIPVDFDRPEDGAKRIASVPRPIEAIIPIDDRGVEMAAGAAILLDLMHNSPQAALATRDKGISRERLDGVVRQPRHQLVSPDDNIESIAADFGGPVVLKPLGLAGSIGVIRVDTPSDTPAAEIRVREIQQRHGYLYENSILVEEFVSGPEVAVEGLVSDGSWDTLAIFDKPDNLEGPYFAETHYVTPSRCGPTDIAAIERMAESATRALDIRQGPVHCEMRLSEDGPVLVELAARPIGGLCGRALRFGLSDTSLEELLIRNALGDRIRGTRLAPGASGVSMIPVPNPGIFLGIDGVASALTIPGVTDIEVGRMIGSTVNPLPEESTYLGFVFAKGDTPQLVEEALRSAVDSLTVLVE